MNLLADEGVDGPIVTRLRQDGHDVDYVAEKDPGISDKALFDEANRDRRLLLTADKDFGEIVFRQQQVTTGVVLIRLAGLSPDAKAEIVSSVLREHAGELPGNFTVIAPGATRIRRR